MELIIDRLSKQYKNKIAVDRISLTLHQGVYGLLGANGAGKTTLMRMLCGILRPTSGTVMFENMDVSTEDYRKELGYLPQDFGYYPNFTGRDFLMYMAVLKGMTKSRAQKRCAKLLDEVGLKEMGDKKITTYSGGMKQRLGIARAVLAKPELLILDEPTNGLDPLGMKQIRDLLRMLCEEYGITILISSHLLSEIENVAHTIGIMNHGKLLQEISMDAITDQNFAYIELLVSDVKKAAYVLDDKLGINNFKIIDINVIRIYDVSISVERVSKVLAENNVGIEGVTKKQDTLEDYFLKLTRE